MSDIDDKHIALIRQNISDLIKRAAELYDGPGVLVLDVAPDEHKGAKEWFKQGKVKTLNKEPRRRCDYTADICDCPEVPAETFDVVVCTDVLEHVERPWTAALELWRILKPGGILVLSTPLDFKEHPFEAMGYSDYWRFTQHGLRLIFRNFEILELQGLDNGRPFFPVHYTMIAKK